MLSVSLGLFSRKIAHGSGHNQKKGLGFDAVEIPAEREQEIDYPSAAEVKEAVGTEAGSWVD